ncbi:MAG: four helix bundle protein [Nitrospirae bacterium]|nr:four helix bundle protein [Nitrospirota bacterium]
MTSNSFVWDLGLKILRFIRMRRIFVNFVEGSADNSDIEFARFLGISIRSVYEAVAGFDLALHYKMIDDKLNIEIEDKAEELIKQLSGFRSSLKS